MIVIAAALFFAFEPLAGSFVKVLTDVRLAIVMLGVNVSQESIEVIARCDEFLRAITQHIGEGNQSLGRGKRPDGTVPFAFAAAMRTEFGMALLGSRDAERRMEALRTEQLCPCRFVSGIGQVEAPWNEAKSLANI